MEASDASQGTAPELRRKRARALREGARRSSHAVWEPSPSRRDPVVILQEQEAGRVPELVPVRHARMLASPFAFFRGAAAVIAEDLAGTPVSGLQVQACGDAHLLNFGVYATPERRLVFDINDFDETLPAPFEWDVKRLAASVVVAGRGRGFSPEKCETAARADRDPLFLQAKEAEASVLERFAGRSRYANHGQRVVAGQRLTQTASDIFLGWTRIEGRDYYVRQLRDMKGSMPIEKLSADELTEYARACGAALGAGHARSGDSVAIAAYLGRGESFDRAIGRFAVAYADQTERDHELFKEAVRSGRLAAEPGL
jgi:uncharacterized protein (DUF2252 family)